MAGTRPETGEQFLPVAGTRPGTREQFLPVADLSSNLK
jgi:hypothetical protein